MFESLPAVKIGLGALSAISMAGSAISHEALALQRSTAVIAQSLESSRVLFAHKADAISSLARLMSECSTADWDSYGAMPMNRAAFDLAIAFIRALPDSTPMPEFAPEPDGSISLDWISSRTRVFSLSIGASNRLAYAWLDGTDQGHAVARFDGRNVPLRIQEGIDGIVEHSNAALRVA